MKNLICQDCRVIAKLDPSPMLETGKCSKCGLEGACFVYLDKFEVVEMYLHSDKESNYEKGEELGLTGEALKNFAYALYEVKITLKVDTETGKYEILKAEE